MILCTYISERNPNHDCQRKATSEIVKLPGGKYEVYLNRFHPEFCTHHANAECKRLNK